MREHGRRRRRSAHEQVDRAVGAGQRAGAPPTIAPVQVRARAPRAARAGRGRDRPLEGAWSWSVSRGSCSSQRSTASTRRWSSAACGQVELGEDGGDVLLDGGQADDETVGDGRVGAALRHEAEHVPLARGEGLEARPTGPGEDLGDDLGVDHGAAGRPRGRGRRGTRRRRPRGPSARSRGRARRRRRAPGRTAAPRTATAPGRAAAGAGCAGARPPAGPRRCASGASGRR